MMKPLPRALAVGIAAAVLGIASAPSAHGQHAHDDHAAHAAPIAPPATRWPGDATLRENMQKVHETLEKLTHYEMGHMQAPLALDLVDSIKESTNDIFANCKLPEDQDAVLHRMLVPLLAAVQKFEADPADMAQLGAMRSAIEDYPRYFEAPGWTTGGAHAH